MGGGGQKTGQQISSRKSTWSQTLRSRTMACSPGTSEGTDGALPLSLCRSSPFSALVLCHCPGPGALPGSSERHVGWIWHRLPSASCPVVFLSGPELWVSHLLDKKGACFFLRNSCQAVNGRKRAKYMNERHHLGLLYEPTIQCSWQDKTPT